MLIKALCDYADKLNEKNENQAEEGWGYQDIHYRIMLDDDGSMNCIESIKPESEEKRPVKKILIPIRNQKTCICSNIVEHRPLYIFGLNYENNVLTTMDEKSKANKSHEAFLKANLDLFKDSKGTMCKAFYNFMTSFIPENETENQILLSLGKSYSGSYYVFGLSGSRGNLEDDEEFKAKYRQYYDKLSAESDTDSNSMAMCSVLGKKLPVARIHDNVKLMGGLPTGCKLVCMKETAFESYGKSQSFNSNVSEEAMKKYTSALNHLLEDKNHRTFLGDETVVYFAIKKDDSRECAVFSLFLGDRTKETEGNLDKLFSYGTSGAVTDFDAIGADKNVTFYVVGLTANSSRICQKFICRDKFGNIIKNLVIHQQDMKINPEDRHQIYFSSIAKQLISPKSSKDKVSPPLITGIMLSAFNGSKYPTQLLENVIRRVKTDSDEDKNHFIKLNDTRAGIIKACLNRKARINGQKEEIIMALDKENKNPAYLCGRLFAVYEKIQQDASGGNLNRTIKDSFFASACGRPASIFPKLCKLSVNHLKVIKRDSNGGGYYSKLVGEIMDGLCGEFPQTLDLDSQGKFIIGYYQQNKDLYTSKQVNDGKDNKNE